METVLGIVLLLVGATSFRYFHRKMPGDIVYLAMPVVAFLSGLFLLNI